MKGVDEEGAVVVLLMPAMLHALGRVRVAFAQLACPPVSHLLLQGAALMPLLPPSPPMICP